MATRHKFDDAHQWNVSDREIERLCAYISDDGAVAAYCGVSRQRVMRVRAAMPARERNPKRFLDSRVEPNSATDGSGAHLVARKIAEDASSRLKESIEQMFRRFARTHDISKPEARVVNLYGWSALHRVKAAASIGGKA